MEPTRWARLMSLSALLALSAACRETAPADTARDEALATLRAADSTFQAAVAGRNVAGAMALYADDAVLMPLAKLSVTGLDAIRADWEHTFGIPGFANASRLVAVEVSQDGTMGLTRGTYEATMQAPDGDSIVERGKWVSVWRREPGGPWRIAVDIYNTDSLPPDHQPSTAGAYDH